MAMKKLKWVVKKHTKGWDGELDDWSQGVSYEGNENWSYRRWAWEFLRRNPGYQQINSHRSVIEKSDTEARAFGRASYKQPDSEYGDDDQHRLWLAESVLEFRSFRDCNGSHFQFPVEAGRIFIVFDLMQTIDAGRAAIGAMLADAKVRINNELDRLGEEMKWTENRAPKIIKPRRDKLIHWLILCDACQYGAPDEQKIRLLYPKQCLNGKFPVGEQLETIRTRIRRDEQRALEMLSYGYLSLVPLDHIQDKSTNSVNKKT
jgi:hypothetical protein